MKTLIILIILSAVLVVFFTSCSTIPKGAVAIRPFDKASYLGKWYEIARLDFTFERNMNNTTANYSLNENGTIKVVNRGFNYVKGTQEEATGKAIPAGKPDEARLKVSFFGPFYAPYNVIALDENYKYALVAGKNTKYMWILSREKTIPEDIKKQYLEIAGKLGFRTDDLIWVEHNRDQE
jgi:apolipoprotein D and lipocalin family protein